MIKTFSYIFYLRNPKGHGGGPIRIYLRITIEERRTEISTGREVLSDKWNSASGRMKGKS